MDFNMLLDMKPEQERVRLLLSDTITLLCRNGLHFSKHLRLEGVIGVTVDDTDVFIVHINELLSEQLPPPPLRVGLEDLSPYLTPSVIPLQQQLVCAESTPLGKQKRDDGDGKSTSKRCKTEVVVPAHHHHHNPNTTITTNPQLPSPYVRCPTALLPSGKDYSDCRENIYTSVVSNNPHDPKVLSSRKDERTNARHQDAPHHGMTPTSGAILLDQWHFNVPKRPADRPTGIAPAEPQACYIQYGNEMVEGTSGAVDKKTSLFPPLSVLPMQFAAGVAMAAVDYNSASTAPAPVISSRGTDCQTDGGTAQSKIWGEASSQIQPQQNSTNERLVFDSLAGCSSWTVSQLMTNQGIMGSDEQHQSHDSSVQVINQLTYNQENNNCSELSGIGGTSQRGSKESRRSWTSKHKPHACQHPGCRKSYFFVHDLRRHLRQKHDGMDYNETSGRFEAALDDSTSQIGGTDCQRTVGSPMTVHDTDDQSPDSDDDTDVMMAAAAHASSLDT